MRFTKGFEYMGKPYGWKDKKLYKLPHKHIDKNIWFNLLEVAIWEKKDIHVGFQLGNVRKSFSQLKKMTHDIDVEIKEYHKDTPF